MSKKGWIIGLVVCLLVAGGGALAWYFLVFTKKPECSDSAPCKGSAVCTAGRCMVTVRGVGPWTKG